MNTTRKTVIGIAIATAITTAAATAVFAHGDGPGAGYGQMQGGPGMMGGHGRMMGGPGMMSGQGHMMGGPGMMGQQGQMMGGPGMMGGQDQMMGDSAAFVEQSLESYKTQLGITSEQEVAWKQFANTRRGQAQLMNAHHQAMAGGDKEFSFTDHFAQMEAGAAQMQAVAAAAKELHAVLTPEQQTRADSLMKGGCRS